MREAPAHPIFAMRIARDLHVASFSLLLGSVSGDVSKRWSHGDIKGAAVVAALGLLPLLLAIGAGRARRRTWVGRTYPGGWSFVVLASLGQSLAYVAAATALAVTHVRTSPWFFEPHHETPLHEIAWFVLPALFSLVLLGPLIAAVASQFAERASWLVGVQVAGLVPGAYLWSTEVMAPQIN